MKITLSDLRKLIHETAVKAEAFDPRNHGGMKGFLSVITKVIRALDKGGFRR